MPPTDPGILTDVMTSLLGTVQSGYAAFHLWAMRLFALLVALDITLIVILPMLRGQSFVPGLVKRLITILVIFLFISNYDYWVNLVVNGGIAAGIKASTAPESEVLSVLKNPSLILDMPFKVLGKLWDGLSVWNPLNAAFILLLGLLMVMAFAIVAITVVITYLEFAFAATLALILLPFAGLKQTAFIGEKVFSLVVSYAIRLMVLVFILGIGHTYFNDLGDRIQALGEVGWREAFTYLIAGTLYLMLAISIPKMAAGLFSGSPSLGAGDAAMAAGGAALAGAGMAFGTVGGLKLAGAAAGRTLAGASTASGFTAGAARSARMAANTGHGPPGGVRGAITSARGVAWATGRAGTARARAIGSQAVSPLTSRFEAGRLDGALASKPGRGVGRGAGSASSFSGHSGQARQHVSFAEKQNAMSAGNLGGRGISRTARAGLMTARGSEAPVTGGNGPNLKGQYLDGDDE